ncbi:MAG TPA: MFS transporter [Symbiobacteriaceae bacterium]|nr:MFS transporter [Symbiobacteriaceae bacterium]
MLNSSLRRLVWVNGLWALANGLSGLFTNVYLWRLRPGVTTPAYYNLWVYLAILIAMPLLGGVAKRRGAALINAAGMLLYAGFYLCLLLLQDQAANYLSGLGIFYGLALSCYALGTHVLAYDMTQDGNREFYYNRNGLITSLGGLLAPLAAGWVVSSFPEFAGYRIIFISSFVLFVAAALVGMSLRTPRAGSAYRLFAVVPGSHPGWHRLLVAYTLMGMRDGVFSFAVSLLVYLATGGERSVGNFAFVTAAVGMGAFWLSGRIMTPATRSKLFPVGALLMAVATGIIGLGPTWHVMLAFGLLSAIATPFWQTAYASTAFDVIKQASGQQDLRIEMIAAREIPLNLGRLASLLLVLRLAPSDGSTAGLQVLLGCLGLSFPVAWFLFRRAAVISAKRA